MIDLDRIRNGFRPTLADKLATCDSIEELDLMLRALRQRGAEPDSAEALAAQNCRARLLGARR